MPAKKEQSDQPDLAAFREWLVEQRGLARASAYTAVSQVRRVLRECAPHTNETKLAEWHEATAPHLRTPVVSNWRRYREWWLTQGIPTPDFPRSGGRQTASVPAAVTLALGQLQTAGLTPATIHALRWEPLDVDSPIAAALMAARTTPTEGTTALKTPMGLALVPAGPLQVVVDWSYPRGIPRGAPVCLDGPEGPPMTITRLKRLARKGRGG